MTVTSRSKANWNNFEAPLVCFCNENVVFVGFFGIHFWTNPLKKWPRGALLTILCVNTCVKGVFKWGYHIIGIFEVYSQIFWNISSIFLIYSLIIPYLNFKHPILHLMFSKFYCSWIKHTLYFNAPCLLIFLRVPPGKNEPTTWESSLLTRRKKEGLSNSKSVVICSVATLLRHN